MTTEAADRRRVAREREASAPFVTPENLIMLEQQQMPPSGDELQPDSKRDVAVAPDGISVKNDGYMTLYKKVPYGWKPTRVAMGTAAACLETGEFRMTCGDCGGHCGLDPNSCPKRPPLAFRACPVCDKHIFDTPNEGSIEETEPAPGEIRDDVYKKTTPEQRTKVKLDNHIVAFHPSYAQGLGLINSQTGSVMPLASEAARV